MTIFLRRLAHYAVYFVAGVIILLSCVALALRFVIMPDIGRYKPDIEAAASRAVGIPVKIDEIKADWSHLNPRFSLRNLTLAPAGRPSPLRLNQVDATLSWLSLGLMEPHLTNLDIRQSTLEIRRDKAGVIFVAGIPVNQGGAPSPFPDWLLRQHSVTVSDGKVIWIDEVLNAPPLTLDHVNLGLANLFGRHRFGLVARPPADAARGIDIRGDLSGRSVHDIQSWHGQVYLKADEASAAALNTWWPWAQSAVRRSVGNVRFWMNLDRGHVQSVTGDVRLADVAVSLAEGLPDMRFSRVSGRLVWSRKGDEQTYSVQGLRFATPTGQTSEPTDVKVSFTPTDEGKIESARVVANGLRLEALTALSGTVPLPRQAHDWINAVNPHGFIEHIDFNWLGREHFRLAARFREAGMNPTRKLPGLTGLNGEVEADELHGRAMLDSRALHIVYDAVFRQPIDLSRMATELKWNASPNEGYRFDLAKCELSNPDLDATAVGSLTWRPGKAPVVDIQAHLTRGNGDAVWRYLPHQVEDDAYHWLKQSIVGGTSPDTRLVLRGPLDQFPFDQGGGVFQVDVHLKDGMLNYAPDWPRITGINGLLTFQNERMSIQADSGEISGARLSAVRAVIPDLFYTQDKALILTGQADGPIEAFLDFIRHSPVNEHMGHFVDEMKSAGTGTLKLKLQLPLRDARNTEVSGQFDLKADSIALNDQFPPLTGVDGRLNFTDTWVKGDGLRAHLFGEPIVISLNSEDGGRVHAGVSGDLTADTLARWLPAALKKRVSGATQLQADVVLRQHTINLKVTSRLAGLAIDLPAPLGKPAGQEAPLTLTLQDSGQAYPPVSFSYDSILSGILVPADVPQHARLAIMLGGLPAAPPKDEGITVQGSLRQFDFDAWRHLDLGGGGTGLPIRSVNLSFNELSVFGRLLHDVNVQAQPEDQGWQLELNGREVAGEARYGPQPGQSGDSLIGRFKKVDLPSTISASAGPEKISPDDLPKAVDLAIQSFAYDKHELGELTLKLTSAHDGLAIDTFALKSPETQLETSGWLSASPLRTTRLKVKLDSDNVGHLMRRLGYTEGIKGGRLSVQGTLEWLGRPEDFDKDRLGGTLAVELKNGRFTQLDPGAAKLLGILSLQALPRRITLDFRDIFSEGFAFDSINGDVLLDRGIGYLPGLSIQGPAAKINMKGKIDLVRENQELRLDIQPRLDEGVAVAGALLGGPVVGVGTLVATKILKNPIAQAASFEYLVTGSWGDPVVAKLAKPVAGNAPAKP